MALTLQYTTQPDTTVCQCVIMKTA